MCVSPTAHEFLAGLPKCEHHLHLEGALTPQLLFELAARNKITLPQDDEAFKSPEALLERYQRFTSLDDFLHYYYISMSVLIKPSDFEALAYTYFTHAHESGVVHAETFFDPQAHLSRGISYDTILTGFLSARTKALATFSISSELIACFLRHLPLTESVETFHLEALQESLLDGTVKGIGLDSSEAPFPPRIFAPLFAAAGALPGVELTAHAGEEGPASFITDALDLLGVSRIDHGTHAVDDEALMSRLASQGTLLTLCPRSNVFLKVVPDYGALPVRAFLDRGVRFSLNSDDPAYFGGWLLDNYCQVHAAFDLPVADWHRIARWAVEGSWCSRSRKEELLRRVDEYVALWKDRSLE